MHGWLLLFAKSAPDTRIVVLGRETNHVYLGLLLASGALGYVLLQSSLREMVDAIRIVSKGRRFMDHKLRDELFDILAREAEHGTKHSAAASGRFSP